MYSDPAKLVYLAFQVQRSYQIGVSSHPYNYIGAIIPNQVQILLDRCIQSPNRLWFKLNRFNLPQTGVFFYPNRCLLICNRCYIFLIGVNHTEQPSPPSGCNSNGTKQAYKHIDDLNISLWEESMHSDPAKWCTQLCWCTDPIKQPPIHLNRCNEPNQVQILLNRCIQSPNRMQFKLNWCNLPKIGVIYPKQVSFICNRCKS